MDKKIPRKRFQYKKKKEVVLVFDENSRREFLTGFHKRKVQRKTKAAEELDKQLKLERKKIKSQTKLMYDKLIKSQKPIPEASELVTKEIDMGEHSVSVTEVSTAALAKTQNWIGENQVEYHQENIKESTKKSCNAQNVVCIEGMDITEEKGGLNNLKFKTKKDLKKMIKKEATQHVRKSKVFKTKSRVAQIQNKKKKRREEWKRQRQNNKKKGKHRKKCNIKRTK